MGVNQMTGSPWHAERVHREEGDARRYKGRCAYYVYEKGQCTRRNGRCTGSAHCMEYKSISEEEFKKRQKRNNNKNKSREEDYYWL